MTDQNNAPELPDRIWLDERTFNGAVGFAHSKQHHPGAWAEYIRADRAAPEGQATPPDCQQEAVTVALKLAATRLHRLALEIPSTTSLRADAFKWAEEGLRALKGER